MFVTTRARKKRNNLLTVGVPDVPDDTPEERRGISNPQEGEARTGAGISAQKLEEALTRRLCGGGEGSNHQQFKRKLGAASETRH